MSNELRASSLESENRDKRGRLLIIACGALAKELVMLIKVNQLDGVDIECLPAKLHNTPKLITEAVERKLDGAVGRYENVFVGYADCGTGGLLDEMLARRGVERLPGAHCYEFFAGSQLFASLHEAEPGTFYLTDYLTRHFERLMWQGLGLDRWPELRDEYFRNYRRIVYLSQTQDAALVERAREAAARLQLDFEHVHVGYGDLATSLMTMTTHGGAAA
jgi:hypothetical protein